MSALEGNIELPPLFVMWAERARKHMLGGSVKKQICLIIYTIYIYEYMLQYTHIIMHLYVNSLSQYGGEIRFVTLTVITMSTASTVSYYRKLTLQLERKKDVASSFKFGCVQ